MIHTSLAFVNDQGLPPRDLLESRTGVARARDGLVRGDTLALYTLFPFHRASAHTAAQSHDSWLCNSRRPLANAEPIVRILGPMT